MLPCMSKKILGIDCPGCGGQRALIMLLKGDFSNAFNMFPAIFTTVILVGLIGLQFFDKNRNYQKIIVPLAIINALIMFVAYFYKMTNF